ncbi:hypothetical protein [Lewinella sp. W8]|uniref:hypothetical protein n=1 Tax=Lewinella sp. W8 TaxID=2528208 RepID=UPI0010679FF5|nr:hypothetical protein [Lewinella sp. W8]MTB51901.1 hypothetical protein [Lewinella sp. W8]
MQQKVLIFFFLVGILSPLAAQQQGFEGFMKAGDAQAAQDNHYNAYRNYEAALQFLEDADRDYGERVAEAYYKTGISAYRASAYTEAEKFLLLLANEEGIGKYALTQYFLGQATFRQGKYDLAAAYFQQFLDQQPNAPEAYRSAALAQINDADWAIDAMSRTEDIVMNHLPEGVNTSYMDLGYVHGPSGTRFFSSNRFVYKNDTIRPKRDLSRIMKRTGETTAQALPSTINIPGKNVAHVTFNREQDKVFYCVCDFKGYDETRCDIYTAEVTDGGDWVNPKMLDLNVEGFNTTTPSVGLNADNGQEYLFFASDRPGGKGGLDLYRSSISADGSVGEPENIEYLNTEGNDATPFWYSPRQTLFFSTDGRFTFGGLDIYKSYWVDGSFRRPVNLGAPVNSAADEGHYTRFNDPADIAYVSSRRPGPDVIFYDQNEQDVCCYDIYSFTPDPRISLQALTFNELTDENLIGATVELYKVGPNGPELVETITNLEGNEFNFLVDPEAKYQLKATKEGYTEDLDEFDLADPEFADKAFIERKLYLSPKVNLDVFTFNNVDGSDLPGATVRLYEVGEDGTRILIEEFTNEEGNDSHFPLLVGKKYLVEADKPGFGKASSEVDLRNYDPAEGTSIRRDLYLGQLLEVYVVDGRTDEPLNNATLRLVKADGTLVGEKTNPDGNDFYYTVNLDQPFVLSTTRQGYFPRVDTLRFSQEDLIEGGGKLVYEVPLYTNDIESFLPFDVYFDNDHPNPDNYTTQTDLTYDETYLPYEIMEEIFKKAASEGLSNEEAFVVRGDIQQLFDQEVRAGWKQLTRFADALILYMETGNSFTVQLQGFASPRAPTEYNRRLSARRNMSLKNFFASYKNGALAPYIGKQLTFTEAALGESEANLDAVYERLDRPRESIYSYFASLQRRVELSKGISPKKK